MVSIKKSAEKFDVHLIFCSFVPVGLNDYINYFRDKFSLFTCLQLKFPHGRVKSSIAEYLSGRLQYKKQLFSFAVVRNQILYFLVLPINYFFYLMQVLLRLGFAKRKKETVVFMGVNYFCALCGLLLKKLGKVDFVIYRVMDFFPLPPSGMYRILNRVFYVLDRYCLNNADEIWFTTKGHIIGREKYGYFDKKKYKYQMIPLGLDVSKFISKPVTKKTRHTLVYCGVVSKYHMLDLLFEVIKELKKEFEDIKLNLIGSGPDEDYYKKLAVDMGLKKNIIFHGFVPEGAGFRKLMASNVLGIAFYKDEENFMKYTEPAKVKYYLSFGVPAVVSKVPTIAKELARKKVCFAVPNSAKQITRVIRKYITSKELQKEYKKNIREFVKTIDINYLLDSTFEKSKLKKLF